MESILFKIDDERLQNPGGTLTVAAHIDQASYTVGSHEFALPEGIDYDLVVTNAGEGILVTGLLKCHAIGTCDRCLEDAVFDIAAEVDEYYLFEEPEQEDDEDEDIDFALVIDDKYVDLSEALDAALVMETPFVVLCSSDCRGLCPDCGANLNEQDCGCADKREQEKLKESPFAVLQGLDLDE